MSWANGLGTTREIARADRDSKLLWRLSMADVVADGPFSLLPGTDRTILLVSGDRFELDFGPNGRTTIDPVAPTRFSGDWGTCAVGVTSPSVDLNVMTARGAVVAETVVHHEDAQCRLGWPSLLVALEGRWTLETEEGALHVQPEDSIIADLPNRSARILGSGRLVEVRIDPIWQPTIGGFPQSTA